MKFVMLLLVIGITTALLYKFVWADDEPAVLRQEIISQSNPFTVSKDSSAAVWKRALQLMKGRKSLLAGGALQETDSTLFLPYYNDYHKGNSVLIERKTVADSVVFKVSWWYAQTLQQRGSQEIALFMQRGISRYNNY